MADELEEWRLYLKDAYLIANTGKVKRAKQSKGATVGKLIRIVVDRNGYQRVCLSVDGKPKYYWLHRVVAAAFLREPIGNEQVNHKDGNKINNHIDNLEYVTPSKNIRHAVSSGLIKPGSTSNKGQNNGSSKLTDADVTQMRELRSSGFTLQKIADSFGMAKSQVGKICARQLWKHIP